MNIGNKKRKCTLYVVLLSQIRLDGTKKQASFEIAALFSSPYRQVKSAVISKLACFYGLLCL